MLYLVPDIGNHDKMVTYGKTVHYKRTWVTTPTRCESSTWHGTSLKPVISILEPAACQRLFLKAI